jgi:ribonuclease HI
MHVTIYTDGACRGNPGLGGWAALLRFQSAEKEISGVSADTTNNRMELTAAIEGLKALKRACEVDLYTDSQYLRQGMTAWLFQWKKNGWKGSNRQPVKNIDLWQMLDELAVIHKIRWHWVKGHSGHPENERVDAIANDAIDRYLKGQA